MRHILRYVIYDAMRLVLDTNVVVAGVRGQFAWCCSVPLFYEYEDVLNRAEFLLDAGITRAEIGLFLTDLAGIVRPVDLRFLWRPQLRDPGDEMVLETGVNGRAVAIVTHNTRDFGDAPGRFGIEVWSPADALRRLGQ